MSDVDDGLPRPRLTRGAGVIGVLAVIAGFGGGFAAGYATHDEPDDASVAAVAGPAADSDAGAVGSATATTFAGSGWVASAPGGEVALAPGAPSPPERLFRRDTADGLSVRVFESRTLGDQPPCDGQSGWCPPAECTPTSFVEAHVIGEWAMAVGGGARSPLGADPARVLGVAVNWFSDEPVFGVVVGTSPEVSSVRLSIGDHADEMAPIDGLAVLAVPTGAANSNSFRPYPDDAVVEAVTDGSTVALDLQGGFRSDPACVPPPPAPPAPPSLPAAGEQPSDPDAARAAIEAVYDQAFGGSDDEALAAAVDDPSGMQELREELRARYPQMVGGRTTYEITDIVFTSATEAAYYFRPVIADYAELPRQVGHARIVDGEWKVTRDTVCAMFRLGGTSC